MGGTQCNQSVRTAMCGYTEELPTHTYIDIQIERAT